MLDSKHVFVKNIWTNPGLFSVHLSFQKQLQFQFTQHKLKKMKLVCLRFEPGATGWQAQSKLWNYGAVQISKKLLNRSCMVELYPI